MRTHEMAKRFIAVHLKFELDMLAFFLVVNMVEENPRDVGHEMDELSIVYGDESLPRLYENSRISSD